ncbi:hypothetical protein Tco_1491292 [Tanacetum coccineum]
MTQTAIRKLVADSVTAALEAQAATMSSSAVNLSTLMVRKEQWAYRGLNERTSNLSLQIMHMPAYGSRAAIKSTWTELKKASD